MITVFPQIQSACNMQRLQEAQKLILSYPKTHLHSSLYMKILQLCIDTKAKNHGRFIHSHIITNGFDSNLHLSTKLIIFYAKLGDTETARNVFDKMPDRSIVSWTAMISGYTQNGFFENSLLMFLDMRRAGFKANQFSYGSALRACTSLRCINRGMQIQGCIEKGRFVENLFVKSALVDLHSKCGNMEDACFLFETMSKRDVVSWNAMINGYAVQGFVDDSFRMFCAMMREGGIPDNITLGTVLRTSARGGGFMKVNQIHKFIIQLGFESDNALTGSLIDAYAKCGSIGSAHFLYRSMPRKDIISCTALITGCVSAGNYNIDALDLFKEISQMRMGIDSVLLCSMLNICANIASLSLGRQIHALVLKYQSSYDTAMGNALIDMYAKCGEIEDAQHVFDEMGERNVITWTSLIAGYGKHGYGHKAVALYEKMEYEGLKPNDVTFLSLLFACSHTGLTGEGWKLFNDMVNKYNIIPRADHFSCVVDLFARKGWLEEAYDLICKMDIKPNASLWGSILGACSVYGNLSLGEVAATHLFDMDPEKSVNYVVLASIYAASGAWDDALETRKLIKKRSLRKHPGCSRLQSTEKKIELLLPS